MFSATLDRRFPLILRISGIVTMLAGLQFLGPAEFLGALGMKVGDSTGLFYARHWGALVLCLGALIVAAASRPALRVPVVAAAAAEKLALVVMVILAWQDPALAGLHGAAVFDSVCVLLYALWLVQAGKKPSIDR